MSRLIKYRNFIVFTGVAVGLVFCYLWIAAPIVHLYYQTKAGNLIDETLSLINNKDSVKFVCSQKPVAQNDQRSKVLSAIENLDIAVRYYSKDSYTYLMLGRAYCIIGEFDKAIVYFESYNDSNPQNPIGRIEQGFAYEAVGKLQDAKEAWITEGLRSTDFLEVGDADRKNGAFDEAKLWETRAVIVDDSSHVFLNDLANERTKIIEGFSVDQGWVAYPNNSAGAFSIYNGILTMSYGNDKSERDTFSWITDVKVPISNYENLKIKLYGKEGTYFTVETVIDGERSRKVNYLPVPQEWSVISIPISGNILEEITIGIGEPETEGTYSKYELSIDWIGVQ